MRAELPWNVAGIPPEAREAARAAARREGLSVGEWLTRRILRSFSDMGEDPQPLPVDRMSSFDRTNLDPWGLPPSSASRRDTEDMLARVSRSESESSDATRRIEEQLRSVARRLDSAERSQSENNRAMSKTASEINIATREQSQAFDQLGSHVMNMSDRIERLERSAAQDGLKDAVKALHQGLSRLADQITQTANQSATQVSSLAGNLEQMASRVGQLRADTENAAQALEQRLGSVEKASQFNTNALDHALEKLEAQANIRAGDLAEAQKRETQTEVTIMRLEENLSRLENKSHDPALDRRLDGMDRALADIARRLESSAEPLEDSVRALARRLDTAEKNHSELLSEIRANLARPAAPEEPEPDYIPPQFAQAPFAPPPYEAPTPPAAFEAPPFAESPAAFAAEGYDHGAFPPGFNAADPFASGFAPDNFAAPTFAAPGLEAPQGYVADPAISENFLSAARRSAQAASQAESLRRSGFAWGASASAADKPRSRYVIPAIVGFVVLLALAAGLVLSQRMKTANAPAPATTAKSGGTAVSVAPPTQTDTTVTLAPSSNAPFVPAPQSGGSTGPERTVLPLAERPVHPAPVHSVPGGAPATPPAQGTTTPATPAPAANAGDRVTQLANAGNPIAETILGLKYLDGQGVPVDLARAGKLLARAADQGHAVAQYRLGTMYERGQGTTADPAKAAKWYQAAANQGNRKAMHNLAVAFADGATGKKDMAEAARWFSKAAALGLSDSQFNLAVLYERGDGVPQSLIDAYKWYAIAAAAGDSESKQRLSVLQTQLSDTDRGAAQKSAASFHAAALNRSANVPPEAADLPAQ